MANDNILTGWKCPECGNEEDFSVEVSGMASVTDNGCEVGDVEWTDDSFAMCRECDETGIVYTFTEGRI